MVGVATLTFAFNVRVRKYPPIVIQRARIYPLVGPKGLILLDPLCRISLRVQSCRVDLAHFCLGSIIEVLSPT